MKGRNYKRQGEWTKAKYKKLAIYVDRKKWDNLTETQRKQLPESMRKTAKDFFEKVEEEQ